MTLIVARQIGDEVRIISDTKLMDESSLHQTVLDGGLKSVIVSPSCCVCFAGNVSLAERALTPILSGAVSGREQVTAQLLQCHQAFAGEVDFLLACVGGPIAVDRVTQGKLETNLKSAWIGSQPAFDAYQSHYHSSLRSVPPIPEDDWSRTVSLMSDAFKAVIDDHKHDSVGDFPIVVTSKPASKDGFRYLASAGGFGFHPVSLTTTPTSLLRPLGVEGGSYHYTILVPAVAGIGAVAVYLLEGKLGVFFYPAKCWSPQVLKNVGIDEFRQVIQQRFGIRVDGFGIY